MITIQLRKGDKSEEVVLYYPVTEADEMSCQKHVISEQERERLAAEAYELTKSKEQLRQERDEARREAQQELEHHEFYRQKCSDYMQAEQSWLKVQQERDQLRQQLADKENK